MINIVGVSELKAGLFIPRLVFVEDFLERDYFGAKKIRQFGQVDAVAQVLLALGSRREFLSNTRLDPPFKNCRLQY